MSAPGDCPGCGGFDFEAVKLSIAGKPGEAHQCRACGWPGPRPHANAVRPPDATRLVSPVREAING